MSLPNRIKQIADNVATDIFTSSGFVKSQQAATSFITSGTVTALSGANATVQLDNGVVINVTLSNNQYTSVGARIDVVGMTIAV